MIRFLMMALTVAALLVMPSAGQACDQFQQVQAVCYQPIQQVQAVAYYAPVQQVQQVRAYYAPVQQVQKVQRVKVQQVQKVQRVKVQQVQKVYSSPRRVIIRQGLLGRRRTEIQF